MKNNKMLSQSVADSILSMITIEKQFCAGDRLPNELELSAMLHVSRTTLREAIRILVAYGVLEIQRGKGTYVTSAAFEREGGIEELADIQVNVRDLYEMRLIFEPEAAYLAAVRGTETEIKRILELGRKIEQSLEEHQDRTREEQAFHKAIAEATHNEFMNKLMPVLYQAISKGVILTGRSQKAKGDTISDHKMIMEFLEQRNAEGARNAMKIHIMHAMQELDMY